MSGSARRLGYDVDDPHLEERLRGIELELGLRALSNNEVSTSASRRHRSSPPILSGVRVDNNVVGGISVRWNPSDLPDLRTYELQFSPAADFTGARTVRTGASEYLFPEGVADTDYFVKVRQYNSTEAPSDWSAVLNVRTGQATFTDLAAGAASNIISNTQVSGFDPATILAGDRAVYLPTIISLPTSAEVCIFGKVTAGYTLNNGDTLSVNVRVDGVTKENYTNAPTNPTTLAGSSTLTSLALPILLGVGDHIIDFEITMSNVAGSSVSPTELKLFIWEQRN